MQFTTTAVMNGYAFPRNITSPKYTIIYHYLLSVSNVSQIENVFHSQMYENKHFLWFLLRSVKISNAVVRKTLTHYYNTSSITESVYVLSPSRTGNYFNVQTRLIFFTFLFSFTLQLQHFPQQNSIIGKHVHESL